MNTAPSPNIPIPQSPKQLSSKAKLFSIAILLIAIVGTSMPFIHMLATKEIPLDVQNIRIALQNCEITGEEYRICRLEQKKVYNWFGYFMPYDFLGKIGKPFPILCCALMILYCMRYIRDRKIQRAIFFSGILLSFSSVYSFLFAFSRKLRERIFIFETLEFESYGHPLYYHLFLSISSLVLTLALVYLIISKRAFTCKFKTIVNFIVRMRTRLILNSNTKAQCSYQNKFDLDFFETLDRIRDRPQNTSLLFLYQKKKWIIAIIISCSILGFISLLAHPLHPNNMDVKGFISLRKKFWNGEIDKETLREEKKLLHKKYYIKGSIKNPGFVSDRSHPLGLAFSIIILFLILPLINEQYARRGMFITGIAFLVIDVFHLRWAFFRFEGKVQDYHINYYYAMMSISTILIILVVYQFVQSAIRYKYKMMELLHFIVGARKQVFTALEAQHSNPETLQQHKEQFDEELYDTLEKVTKK